MSVILGLDIGTKRVGTAISDGSELLATPQQSYERAQSRAEKEICALIEERGIKTVVVGMPYGEKGESTEQCKDVEKFCRRLARRTTAEIIFVDEYGSSVEAEGRLRGKKSAGRALKDRGIVDAAAAAVILQEYLDSRKSRGV